MGNPLVARMQGFGTTIFAEMSALALSTGAINLGQGYPDTDGPREMLDAAVEAISSGRNQYPPGAGVPELLAAIAAHQRRFYGLSVDPAREVLVTAGATEAIAAAVLGLCEPGDEVVTFEPYYDSYAATIVLAGSAVGRIRPKSRRITGACRRHQSQIARAVKRARELALLPYTADQATTLRGGAPERPERGERER